MLMNNNSLSFLATVVSVVHVEPPLTVTWTPLLESTINTVTGLVMHMTFPYIPNPPAAFQPDAEEDIPINFVHEIPLSVVFKMSPFADVNIAMVVLPTDTENSKFDGIVGILPVLTCEQLI